MKMMAVIVTLGFRVSMSAAEGRPLVEITLVSESKARASIVVAQNPRPSARLAALERCPALQSFWARSSELLS
jgi:hypothetical protein